MLSLLPLLAVGAVAAPAPLKDNSIPFSTNIIPFSGKIKLSPARQAQKFAAFDRLESSLGGGGNAKEKRWGSASGSLTLGPEAGGYEVKINIGGQDFHVIIDTGSSDLWVADTNFQCQDYNGAPVPQSQCFPDASLLYDPSKHPDFEPLPYKSNFNITYGLGSLLGYTGYETVSIGNLQVPHTEFSVAQSGYDPSDGHAQGLLGLASPAITSVYYGTDPSKDNTNVNQAPYPPWFYTAVKECRVAPYFSIVLNRPTLAQENSSAVVPDYGSLTLGGRPNVPVTSTSVTVKNPLVETQIDNTTTYQTKWYQVEVDSVNFPGSDKINTKIPTAILDTGTTFIVFPPHIVDAFYSQFGSNPYVNQSIGQWIVDCQPEKAPSFSITIGGQAFSMTTADLVFPSEGLPSGKCMGSMIYGLPDQETGFYVLGDRFLVNVLMTANIQTNEITITQRQPY